MPSPSRLEHIPLIEGTTTNQTSLQPTLQLPNRRPPTSRQRQLSPLPHSSYTRADGSIFIGAGQPAVPATLVRKIRAMEFIDMEDFSPNQLGIPANHQGEEASRTSSKGRTRTVSSIVEWLQCYAIYLSVMCRVHPEKIPDMLAYQIIILEASLEFEGNAWLGYDRRFRQNAAAEPNIKWGTIDTDLWRIAFAGRVKRARCTHCFSLYHSSAQCDWAPRPTRGNPVTPNDEKSNLCRSWNRDPRPGCGFVNCQYRHICDVCYDNPNVPDRFHKGISCPYRPQPLMK